MFGAVLLLLMATSRLLPASDPIDYTSTVVLFFSDNCAHCHAQMQWMESIQPRFPTVQFVQLEIDARNIAANKTYYQQTMARLGSRTNGWPRTVIGNRVFIGYSPGVGPLEYLPPYRAYLGHQNQLLAAMEALAAGNMGEPMPESAAASPTDAAEPTGGGAPTDDAGPTGGAAPTDDAATSRAGAVSAPASAPIVRNAAPATDAFAASVVSTARRYPIAPIIAGLVPALYLLSYVVLRAKVLTTASRRRYWIGGFVALSFVTLFVVMGAVGESTLAAYARRMPFPLFVTLLAAADGFNPCAFTVLFILLSLLTRTNRRSDMVTIGGVFVAAGAVVYFLFIVAMVAVGSFLLANIGSSVIRLVGLGVMVMGLLGIKDFFAPGTGPSASLTNRQKAGVSRRAGRVVRRLAESRSVKSRVAAVGGTIVLAVVVNAVELGCTAVLPAVYMSGLLATYGTRIGAPHLLWTAYYAVVYVLPMVAIVAGFLFTFRSQRLGDREGRVLKLAGGVLMLLLGAAMTLNPALLTLG